MKRSYVALLGFAPILAATPVAASPALILGAVALATAVGVSASNSHMRPGNTRRNMDGSADGATTCQQSHSRFRLSPAYHKQPSAPVATLS